jgi:hypothetical protein
MFALRQLNVNTSSLPRLERLERLMLDVPFVSRGDTSISAPVIIPNAPLLREVKTIDVPYLHVDPRNPFECLTTLDFKRYGHVHDNRFLAMLPEPPGSLHWQDR